MKLTVNPKRLFKFSSKKTSSSSNVTRSDPASSSTSSSDSCLRSPTTVLASSTVKNWSNFSSDLYSELSHAFKLIDRNGDGKISKSELRSLLTVIGISDDEIAMMLNEVDRDGDGCISFEEFGAISSAFKPASDVSEIRETFDFFDSDRDGKITAEELFNVFSEIGEERCTLEDCKRMIRGVDNNGDGFVCFEDFTRMMGQQR